MTARFWGKAIAYDRLEGKLDTPEALDRAEAKSRRLIGDLLPDDEQRRQAEQDVDWALTAPLDEVPAALRKPPAKQQPRAVNQIREKSSHARVRTPRSRPRERRAARSRALHVAP